ncbi:MAG: response regulator, partial [Gammaproteobacteria bacterium]|nr:response regulator [Gammaproteobacteria bacterium]
MTKSMQANTILVVEDEQEIRDLLQFSLSRAGFNVDPVADAEQALEKLSRRLPSLVLIDWMLPGIDGLELARRIRYDEVTKQIPLIMLTARGAENDKLKSFDSGIDDYVTKPFSPRELTARIKAVLRRTGMDSNGKLSIGKIEIDTLALQVTIDEEIVHLRPTEYRLLELFLRNPKRAYSRAQLLDLVWERSSYVDERTVDVHILR